MNKSLKAIIEKYGEPDTFHMDPKTNEPIFIFQKEFGIPGPSLDIVAFGKDENENFVKAGHHIISPECVRNAVYPELKKHIKSDKTIFSTEIKTEIPFREKGLASVMIPLAIDFIKTKSGTHIVRFSPEGLKFIKPKYERLGYIPINVNMQNIPWPFDVYTGWMYKEY